MNPLMLFSPWFGPWPAWINLHLLSCAANPEVDWVIHTDQVPPENRPANVRFVPMTFAAFCERVSKATGVRFAPPEPYKVCDVRPMLAHVFEDEVEGYRSWGYSDIDVVFGNIRKFYDDDLLGRYEAISSHEKFLSGHLSVFKNSRKLRLAYRRRPGSWQRAVSSPDYLQFDEHRFRGVFQPGNVLQRMIAIQPALFVERYSTVDAHTWIEGSTQFPQLWTWRDGAVRTDATGDREFLYLHFMNWRTQRHRTWGTAPWLALGNELVRVDWRAAETEGFAISHAGFTPLLPPAGI